MPPFWPEDRQGEKPAGLCRRCQGEIYPRAGWGRIDGDLVCARCLALAEGQNDLLFTYQGGTF